MEEKGEFYLRTMTQQSANLTTAIGGSLLGVPLWATAFGVFGTTAAGENKAASVSRVAMGEKSKISVRNIRRDYIEKIRKLQKNGEISEDQKHQDEFQVQEITNEVINNIELSSIYFFILKT